MPVRRKADRDGAYVAVLLTGVAASVFAYVAMQQAPVRGWVGPWLSVAAVPSAGLFAALAAVLAARPYGLRRQAGTDAAIAVCALLGMMAGYAVRAEPGLFELWRGQYEVVQGVPREMWLFGALEAIGLIVASWLLADLLLRGPLCGLCGEHCRPKERPLVAARGDQTDLRLLKDRQWAAFKRKPSGAGWLRFDLRACRCSATVTLDVYRGRFGRQALSRDQRLSGADARTIRDLGRVLRKGERATAMTPTPAFRG